MGAPTGAPRPGGFAPFGSPRWGGDRGWVKPKRRLCLVLHRHLFPQPSVSRRVMEADGRDAGSHRADVSRLNSAAGGEAPPPLPTISGAPIPPPGPPVGWDEALAGMLALSGSASAVGLSVQASGSAGARLVAVPPYPRWVGGGLQGSVPREHRTCQRSPRQQRCR